MEKKYFLGIDGGGTKTAFIVIDENNNIVYSSEADPSSVDTVPLDVTSSVILNECKKIPYKISYAFAGLGGVVADIDIVNINNILQQITVLENKENHSCDSDVINALYGGLSGKDGIIYIAGTGSVGFGKYKDKMVRVGGYCYQEGDGGSAYDLGHQALQYLARVIDGRKKQSKFSKALMDYTRCYDFSSLAKYLQIVNRTEVARIAKIVTSYQDDTNAKKIITNSAKEAAIIINTVYKRLGFKSQTCFTVIGSLGNADTIYKTILLNHLHKNIMFVKKENEASLGSALKAKDEYNKNLHK